VAVPADQAQADQVQVASVPVASVPVDRAQVASAVPGNPTARMGTAVARQAAAALVQPVVVAARVTTSGTELAGCPLQFQTRARRRLDLFRQCAFAPIVRPSALAYTSVKPFTQDAIQVWYE
jgi:hypothetical protein